MPLNIPPGEMVFIDANIFYYHFVSLPGLSTACKHFLHRVEQSEITGVTATAVLAEAQRKAMLAGGLMPAETVLTSMNRFATHVMLHFR